MNIRKDIYCSIHQMVGIPLGEAYDYVVGHDRAEHPQEITDHLLIALLNHCSQYVPYYTNIIKKLDKSFLQDPQSYLLHLPILTKELIRKNFDALKSQDIVKRKWYYNTSGGSTGEPIRLIQDQAYSAKLVATQILMSKWSGREFGEPAVLLWGSERDILQGTVGLKMHILNSLRNETWVNAFRMTAQSMREAVDMLNSKPPKIIIAYAQAIYELAQFIEREGIFVKPQNAIMTSAGTLFPFMREKIQSVFQCNVFNRYGSREVGDIACECEHHAGLHVFPWGNYVEIVDQSGNPISDGEEGNILVTCLNNLAMPLVRYSIGDRGILRRNSSCRCGRKGVILEKILGRSVDTFRTSDGTLIDGEFFTHLLYFRDWVRKFQIIQKSPSSIVYKIVKAPTTSNPVDIAEIIDKTKLIMGNDCEVIFEFTDDIPASSSGKYRYTISELAN